MRVYIGVGGMKVCVVPYKSVCGTLQKVCVVPDTQAKKCVRYLTKVSVVPYKRVCGTLQVDAYVCLH